MAGAGAGFHWMSLKQRRSSETEESIDTISPEMAGCYQEIFILGGLGYR
jgi:hypothetical protein